MKRLPIALSEGAIADIDFIAAYVAESSSSLSSAQSYVDRIYARCRKIGDVPRGGRPRDDLMFGLRIVPFERSAIICYLVEEKRVLITNVFHAGRDFEALLRTEQASSDEEGG